MKDGIFSLMVQESFYIPTFLRSSRKADHCLFYPAKRSTTPLGCRCISLRMQQSLELGSMRMRMLSVGPERPMAEED